MVVARRPTIGSMELAALDSDEGGHRGQATGQGAYRGRGCYIRRPTGGGRDEGGDGVGLERGELFDRSAGSDGLSPRPAYPHRL